MEVKYTNCQNLALFNTLSDDTFQLIAWVAQKLPTIGSFYCTEVLTLKQQTFSILMAVFSKAELFGYKLLTLAVSADIDSRLQKCP